NDWLRERRPPRVSPWFVVIALTGPWLLLIDEYWGNSTPGGSPVWVMKRKNSQRAYLVGLSPVSGPCRGHQAMSRKCHYRKCRDLHLRNLTPTVGALRNRRKQSGRPSVRFHPSHHTAGCLCVKVGCFASQ